MSFYPHTLPVSERPGAVIALNSRFPRLTPDSKVEPSAQLPNTKAFMLLTPRKHPTSFYLLVEGCLGKREKVPHPSTGRRMRGRTGKEGTLEQETKGTRSKRREENGGRRVEDGGRRVEDGGRRVEGGRRGKTGKTGGRRKAGGRREETKRAAER